MGEMLASKTVFITVISLIILIISSTHLAGAETTFSVSPAEFTVLKAPPMGKPWRIQQELVVWNHDNVARVVTVSSEIPPENATRRGYEPIPNENWVYPYFKTSLSSSKTIPENSYALVDISFNIPRWENLTGKKWEVWIPVTREAVPPEIALELDVRLKIETSEGVPPISEHPLMLYIVAAIGVGAVIVALGLLAWSRVRSMRGLALLRA